MSGTATMTVGTMYFDPTETGNYTLSVTSTTDLLFQLDSCFGRVLEVDRIITCDGCGE